MGSDEHCEVGPQAALWGTLALALLVVGGITALVTRSGVANLAGSVTGTPSDGPVATTSESSSSSSWGATAADRCDPLDASGCMLPLSNVANR
jgi:MYXO-CTERM domain-containing protein